MIEANLISSQGMKSFLTGKQDNRILKFTNGLADRCLICTLQQIDSFFFVLPKKHNLLLSVNENLLWFQFWSMFTDMHGTCVNISGWNICASLSVIVKTLSENKRNLGSVWQTWFLCVLWPDLDLSVDSGC